MVSGKLFEVVSPLSFFAWEEKIEEVWEREVIDGEWILQIGSFFFSFFNSFIFFSNIIGFLFVFFFQFLKLVCVFLGLFLFFLVVDPLIF